MDNWLWPCLSKKLAQLLTPGLFSAGIIMDNWLWPCLSKELYSLVVNTWFVQCRDHHNGQLVVVLPCLSKELAQLLTPGLSSAMIIIMDNWLWPCLSKELYSLVVNTWFVQCRDHHHGQLVVVLPRLSKELAQCKDRHHGQLVVALPFKGTSLVVNTWFVQCRDRHHGQLVVVLPFKGIIQPSC